MNLGLLLASGIIAGEALMAILLPIAVNAGGKLPSFERSGQFGLSIVAIVAALPIAIPLRPPAGGGSAGGAPPSWGGAPLLG